MCPVNAQVVHATLYTKCELSKVQCCSILVSIKIVFNFHACKAHDMYSIIYIYNIYIYNIYIIYLYIYIYIIYIYIYI